MATLYVHTPTPLYTTQSITPKKKLKKQPPGKSIVVKSRIMLTSLVSSWATEEVYRTSKYISMKYLRTHLWWVLQNSAMRSIASASLTGGTVVTMRK